MRITGIDGQNVQLAIVGYQFPDNTDYDDSNWLRVHLIVDSKLGKWQTVDSSLQTHEVKEIENWFRDLSNNKEVKWPDLTFLEPNLAFQVLHIDDANKTIQIRFDLESRPVSAIDDEEYFINFQLTNKELGVIAEEMKLEYDKFPARPQISSLKTVSEFNRKPWWKFW